MTFTRQDCLMNNSDDTTKNAADCTVNDKSQSTLRPSNSLLGFHTQSRGFLHSLRDLQTGMKSGVQHSHDFYSNESIVCRFQVNHELNFHDGCVNALCFNRSGSLLLSGSDDQKICIWDWMQQKPACYFSSRHKSNIFQCCFMPFTNDCMIVTSGLDGCVRLIELDHNGALRSDRRILRHSGACHKISFDQQNPQCVISCGADSLVCFADIRIKPHVYGRLHIEDNFHNGIWLNSVISRPFHSSEFAVCGYNRYVRVYDRRYLSESKIQPVKLFSPSSSSKESTNSHRLSYGVTSIAYSHDGKELIGNYYCEGIFLFDSNGMSNNSHHLSVYKGHRNTRTVKSVGFYGIDSKYITSGSDCGRIFIWDKNSEKIVWYGRADRSGSVNVVEPHPTCPILAASGFDHSVKILEANASSPISLDDMAEVTKANEASSSSEDEDDEEPAMLRHVQLVSNILQRILPLRQTIISNQTLEHFAESTNTPFSDLLAEVVINEDRPGRRRSRLPQWEEFEDHNLQDSSSADDDYSNIRWTSTRDEFSSDSHESDGSILYEPNQEAVSSPSTTVRVDSADMLTPEVQEMLNNEQTDTATFNTSFSSLPYDIVIEGQEFSGPPPSGLYDSIGSAENSHLLENVQASTVQNENPSSDSENESSSLSYTASDVRSCNESDDEMEFD